MVTAKPERKDFGLTRTGGPVWEMLPVRNPGGYPGSNGHTKSAESILGSFGFALTPKFAGGDELRFPYIESWVVHACLRVIAGAVEQVGFKIWDGPGEDATALPDTHPVVKLFKRPNPWTSWSQLSEMGVIHRHLSGEDFWFMATKDGKPINGDKDAYLDPMVEIDLPVQIHSINGAVVRDDRNQSGRVTTWAYPTTVGNEQKFPVGSVLHFRNYDPLDPCRGIGPCEVASRQLSIAFQAERYGEATLRAGGPGAFVVYEHEMSAALQKEFQEEMDQAMRNPASVGKMKILTGKPSVIPIPQSPKDMMSIEQLKWSRDVVASLNGVPLPIIGVLDMATYSNMKEAWEEFWLFRIAYMQTVEDIVNTSFFPRLKNPEYKNLRLGFDLSTVAALKSRDADLIKIASEILAKGAGLTFNELLDLVGCQAQHPPGGDQRLYLAQLQTAPNPPRTEPTAQKILDMVKEAFANGIADQEA